MLRHWNGSRNPVLIYFFPKKLLFSCFPYQFFSFFPRSLLAVMGCGNKVSGEEPEHKAPSAVVWPQGAEPSVSWEQRYPEVPGKRKAAVQAL